MHFKFEGELRLEQLNPGELFIYQDIPNSIFVFMGFDSVLQRPRFKHFATQEVICGCTLSEAVYCGIDAYKGVWRRFWI